MVLVLLGVHTGIVVAQGLSSLAIKAHTQTGIVIANAAIRLERSGGAPVETRTDTEGAARINALAPGEYTVIVGGQGFQESSQRLVVRDEKQEFEFEFVLIPSLQHQESVDVIATPLSVDTQDASVGGTELRAGDVTSLAGKPASVADALPLVPGVTKDANGEIQIGGVGEQRSALLVNSSDVTDPGTGRFGATVPVSSVETIGVLKTPFLPQYGRFTAGVVTVETKRGGEKWHFTLKEPMPDFRVRSGHIHGLRDATPKFNIGGPLIPNRLFLSQSVEYDLEKRMIRTLSFPHNESKVEFYNSFSQFDYILSPMHFVTLTAHVAPRHINFVNPTFFNPQPASPSYRGLDRAVTMIDHSGVFGGLLESGISQQHYYSRTGAQGEADMVLTPTGNLGNYFARQNRDSGRLEWSETFSINRRGHGLKFGSTISRTAMSGGFAFKPVDIQGVGGQPIERIEFTAGEPYRIADSEVAVFAQDHFRVLPKVVLDGGLRVEHQSKTRTWRLAPRVGAAWTPFGDAKTVFRGGFGVFYDRVPLTIYSFLHYPQQIVTQYTASGDPSASVPIPNILAMELGRRFWFLRGGQAPGNFAPYSQTWSAEIERALSRRLDVRVNYQHSNSAGGMLVMPEIINGSNALVLGGEGRSEYRQLEVTARLSWRNGQQFMASYVRSKALGDLNHFDSYLDDFPSVPLRTNYFSYLVGDTPNRFIAWGFVSLPWKMQMAPIVEYRTGAPYAVLDAARNYVGIPQTNHTRQRNYISFDERVLKEVRVLPKYKVRFSVSGLNLMNHFNALDVHANVADPQFGTFFGHYKRRYRADIEVLF
jgi:hypothetical protein